MPYPVRKKIRIGWYAFAIAASALIGASLANCDVVSAQTPAPAPVVQAAPTTLADAAMASPVYPESGADCLIKAVPLLGAKDAAKFCRDTVHQDSDRAKTSAKSAAKAAREAGIAADPCSAGWLARPLSCDGFGGYGYSGRYIAAPTRQFYSGQRFIPPTRMTTPQPRTGQVRGGYYGGTPVTGR